MPDFMGMADRELLAEIKELMTEVREEHRLNRAAYQQQAEVLLGVVQQNARAFVAFTEAIDRFGDRIEAFGDRIDEFGARLDLQREILLTAVLGRERPRAPAPEGSSRAAPVLRFGRRMWPKRGRSPRLGSRRGRRGAP
jgi:hypothetical protein